MEEATNAKGEFAHTATGACVAVLRQRISALEQALTFRRLQAEVTEWTHRNFAEPHFPHRPLLGAVEELGELAHAHLKGEQGIRGTPEQHETDAKDAVGDCIVYLADYCHERNWELQDIIEEVWSRVKRRDWRASPLTGDAALAEKGDGK